MFVLPAFGLLEDDLCLSYGPLGFLRRFILLGVILM
jgi:hypothetical protein